jgi:hypothetical protein
MSGDIMKYIDIFKQLISEGFSEEVALSVVQVITINIIKPIKKKHLSGDRDYASEIISDAKLLLWKLPIETFTEIITLCSCISEWETRMSIQGIGGCKVKTFKQLLDEKQIAKSVKIKKTKRAKK